MTPARSRIERLALRFSTIASPQRQSYNPPATNQGCFMADVDEHTLNQNHRDPNSAPNQHDSKKPKPIDQEQPMETPEVSLRTPHAQYPMNVHVPKIGDRDLTAAGLHGITQSVFYAA